MPRVKLIMLAAMAILFAQIQCVAACVGQLCSADFAKTESVPPCHRHHNHSHDQTPGSCTDHFIVSRTTSPQAAQVDTSAFSVLGVGTMMPAALLADARASALDFSTFSPPEFQKLPATVFRI
jgi:hypothetical protein